MEKHLINFSSGFLQMNRLSLFLLIAFPISIRLYSPPSDELVLLNRLISSISGTCLLCWLFAIGHKANEKLVSQGITLHSFRFFKGAVTSVAVFFLIILLFSTNENTTVNGFHLQYAKPMFFSLSFHLSFLITILIAAKTLVSAELIKEAGVKEYFTTLLLMLFAAFGLWSIQPRVQNI